MKLPMLFAPTSLMGTLLLTIGAGFQTNHLLSAPKGTSKPEVVAVAPAPQVPAPPKEEKPPVVKAADPVLVVQEVTKVQPPPEVVVAPKEEPKVETKAPVAEASKPEVKPEPPLAPIFKPDITKPVTPSLFGLPDDQPFKLLPDLENPMGEESVSPTLDLLVSIQTRLADLNQKIVPLREGMSEAESKVDKLNKEYRDEVSGAHGKPGVGPKARAIDVQIKAAQKALSSKRKDAALLEQERDGLIELLGTVTRNLGLSAFGQILKEDIAKLVGTVEVVPITPELAKELNGLLVRIAQGVTEVPMEEIDEGRPKPIRPATVKSGVDLPLAIVDAIRSTASSRETKAFAQVERVAPDTVKVVGKVVRFPRPKIVNGYDKPFPAEEKVGPLAGGPLFGGIRATTYYRSAGGSVFSHMGKAKDSGDSGRSFWQFLTGAREGKDGKVVHHNEGVALPPQVYEQVGPASEVEVWLKNPDNKCVVVCSVVDVGPSNRIWASRKKPVVDLTPRTAIALGGTISTSGRSIRGVEGLQNLEVEVVKRGSRPKHLNY